MTDKLTTIGNFFYDIIHYKDEQGSDTNNGFTANELALRYKLADRPVVTSIQQLISIPSRFHEKGNLPLTNGQIDLETRILFGKTFQKIKTYVNLEEAIRFRLEEPANEFRTQALVGYKGLYPVELSAQLNMTESSDLETTSSSIEHRM